MGSTSDGARPIVISRVFRAPVETVFEAWTNPLIMSRWFSSNVRWNAPVVTADVRNGGEYSIAMIHSDGDKFLVSGKYLEVQPNQRLEFTWAWLDGPMMREESVVAIDFKAHPDGTELTLTHNLITDPEMMSGASEGWSGCLEMLEAYLYHGTTLNSVTITTE